MIFISHSSKDKVAALRLQQRLYQRGYHASQLFLDSDAESGIPAGSKWEQVLYERLRDCRAFIVLCSAHWCESNWCFLELGFAKAMGKEVFPVLLEECAIPELAAEHQAVFVHKEGESAYARLLDALDDRRLGPADDPVWAPQDGDQCPFPGLLAFDETRAGVYFGREREREAILEDLRKMRTNGEPRLLMIVGGSGSGKSSLLKAGVLPRVKHKTGDTEWIVLPTLRSGERANPQHTVFDQLAVGVAHLFPNGSTSPPDWKKIRERILNDDAKQAARDFLEVLQDLTLARNRPEATVLVAIDQFEELLAPSAESMAGAVAPVAYGAAFDELSSPLAKSTAGKFLEFLKALLHWRPFTETMTGAVAPVAHGAGFGELSSALAKSTAGKFLKFLKALLQCRNGRLLVIGTMRSDYLDIYERSSDPLTPPFFQPWRLAPFPSERIEEVIRKPASRAHVGITDELVARLKHDTPSAEALPLLAFTLEKLYRRHSGGGKLELCEYETLGGMEGSIQTCIEHIIPKDASQNSKDALRLSFVKHLARANENGEVVCQTARWEKLPAAAKPILDKFVGERLLVMSEHQDEDDPEQRSMSVQVAHEAIFRCWGDLKNWLRISADILRWRRDVQRDQTNDLNWTGLRPAQLAAARDWPRTRRDELTDDEVQWVQEGIIRERVRIVAAATVFLLVTALAVVASWEWTAARAKTIELQGSLSKGDFQRASLDLANDEVESGLAHLIRALDRDPGNSAAGQRLYSLLMHQPQFVLVRSFALEGRRFQTVATSADGTQLVALGSDESAWLWSPLSVPLRLPVRSVKAAGINRDGSMLGVLTASAVFRWDVKVSNAVEVARFEDPLHFAMTPSGRVAAVVSTRNPNEFILCYPFEVEKRPETNQISESIAALDFAGQEDRLVLYHGERFTVWNLRTHSAEPLDDPWEYGVSLARFTADGTLVYDSRDPGSLDEPSRDLLAGGGLGHAPQFDNNHIRDLTVSQDGQIAVLALDSEQVVVWSTKRDLIYVPHIGIRAVKLFNNDAEFFSYGNDGTVRLFDATSGCPLAVPLAIGGEVAQVQASTNGVHLVVLSEDGVITLWRRTGPEGRAVSNRLDHCFVSVTSSEQHRTRAGGRLKLKPESNGAWLFWPERGATNPMTINHPLSEETLSNRDALDEQWGVFVSPVAAVSPDGRTIATAAGETAPLLWNTLTRSSRKLESDSDGWYVVGLRFSEDAEMVYVQFAPRGEKFSFALFRTGDGKQIGKTQVLRSGDVVADVSPRLDRILIQNGATATVLDPQTLARIGQRASQRDTIMVGRFLGDGSSFMVLDRSGRWRLWDTETGLPRSQSLVFDPAPAQNRGGRDDDDYTAAFSSGEAVQIDLLGMKVAIWLPQSDTRSLPGGYCVWNVLPFRGDRGLSRVSQLSKELFGISIDELGAIRRTRPATLGELRRRFLSHPEPSVSMVLDRWREVP